MFTAANLQLHLMQRPRGHLGMYRAMMHSLLFECIHEKAGLYVSAVAEDILGENAFQFFREIESDPFHGSLFVDQQKAPQGQIVLVREKACLGNILQVEKIRIYLPERPKGYIMTPCGVYKPQISYCPPRTTRSYHHG